MGRRILLIGAGLAVAAAGCAAPESSSWAVPEDNPHGEYTCAACHEFTVGAETRMAVEQVLNPNSITVRTPAPEARCTNSGCHEDRGPDEVSFRSVTFEHRDHAGDTVVALSCAGCHGHEVGSEPLTASVDPCSLCHLSEQAAGNRGECRLCHSNLEHAGMTSQGVSIPHEGLPWVDGGCVRCHYDVTAAPTEVSVLSCRTCHDPEGTAVARGIGEDLHDSHTGVGCTSCHEGDHHRIQAMSTAVTLECSQCHLEVHDVDPPSGFPDAGTCNECHEASHQAQQRLVLGLVPGNGQAAPSEKFLDGLTCRSCHSPLSTADATMAVDGSARGCAGCHRPEYEQVLTWWEQGVRDRVRLVSSALSRAQRTLGDGDAAGPLLDSAALLLETVREGGGVHNLPLSHRLLVRAADQVDQAYLDEGRSPPAPPNLGREPRMGLCSYCHYRLDDPWLFEEMSGPFHREVMVGRR